MTAGGETAAPEPKRAGDLRNYAVVTAAYWADTLTDGALRILVLYYFYDLGYSPFKVAMLFLFYEVFGLFRLAVIAQQIYLRYRQGLTKDPRFAALGSAIQVLGVQAERALVAESI